MINEDNLIQSLQKHAYNFIGDDAAVLAFTGSKNYILTKDLLVEDVHFRIKYFKPKDMAHKALHVNLSDLAAMGGTPLYILCGISIPNHLHNYATSFLRHLTLLCKSLDIILIGGDTTASRNKLFISITAIGSVNKNQIKYRSTANKGDMICVIGNIGFADSGLSLLESNSIPMDVNQSKYISSFLRPEAKIREGEWLAQLSSVTSMMDISDGLYIDLTRLCASSNKGAIIDLDRLRKYLAPEISLQLALEGGEDYSLLCTIDASFLPLLSKNFLHSFKYEVKVIGYITNGEGVKLKQEGKVIDLPISPFTHFGGKI